MTRAVVLVPWRGGEPHREASWAFARPRWLGLGLELVTGDRPGRLFSRAGARNDAAAAADDWDVAIVVDADTVVRDAAPVRAAIAQAAETGRIVIPHEHYLGLTARGTKLLLAGDRRGWRSVLRRVNGAPLGVIVIPRPAWDALGGFDERFTGWGGEDVAFARAARTLVGVDRIPGDIWHLWHPRDRTKVAYVSAPHPLAIRYRDAVGRPAAMRALLAERQELAA